MTVSRTLSSLHGLLLFVLVAPLAPAAEQVDFETAFEQLLSVSAEEQLDTRRNTEQQLQDACMLLCVPEKQSERAAAAAQMAGKLGSETPTPIRLWLLKQLIVMGGEESIEPVAVALRDQDAQIRDGARRTLESIPSTAANAKLLEALRRAEETRWQIGLINSLGQRRDPQSIPALSKLLRDPDPMVTFAAANALAKIGGEAAAEALAEVLSPGAGRVRIADAYLRCADKLLTDGNRERATDIYKQLANASFPSNVRLAALEGQLNAAGDQSVVMILEMLASDDSDVREVAAGHLPRVYTPAAQQACTTAFSRLPDAGKTLLISALAAVGEKASLPLALAAVDSDQESLRLAGIRAMARVGNESVVPKLCEFVVGGGDISAAARVTLCQLDGEGIEQAILTQLQSAEPELRGELIDVLQIGYRVGALQILFQEAVHEDPEVRGRALDALANLSGPDEVPALIQLLQHRVPEDEPENQAGRIDFNMHTGYHRGASRDRLRERAVHGMGRQFRDSETRVDPIIEAYDAGNAEARRALLTLLGQIGGERAIQRLREALRNSDPQLQDAAFRALCNALATDARKPVSNEQREALSAELLYLLAKNADNPARRSIALRTFVRAVTTIHMEDQLPLYKHAMSLATRDEERKFIIHELHHSRTLATLRWAVEHLNNPAVAEVASLRVADFIRHHDMVVLWRPYADEFAAALEKIIDVCDDPSLVTRAKDYLAGVRMMQQSSSDR